MKAEGFTTKVLDLDFVLREKVILPESLLLWGDINNFKKLNYDHRQIRFLLMYYYGELVAGVGFYEKRLLGLLKIGSSPHTNLEVQFGHIYIKRQEGQRANEQLLEIFIQSLTKYIKNNNYAYFYLALPPHITDIREFKWQNWKITPNYTYVLDLKQIKKVGLSTFVGKKMRNIIKYAKIDLSVKKISAQDFYQCYEETYKRQQKKPPHPRSLFESMASLKNVMILGAFSGKELASSIIFCEVGKTAYYITSGVRDKYHSSNGTTLLLYSYIEQLLEKGEIEILDLFGANTKKVAYFKSFFDPQFLLYFTATYKYVI